MVLGRGVWSRGPGGWSCRNAESPAGPGAPPFEGFLIHEEGPRPGRTVLVFEPRGMAHPSVETPRAPRRVFASLARVKSEHPVVCTAGLGWGIEPPEAAASGSFETLMHYEMTAGLARLVEPQAGLVPVRAAWSAFTVASALARSAMGARSRVVLYLVPGFVALAVLGPARRSFRSWTEPVQERDWAVILGALGDLEPPGGDTDVEGRLRGGAIVVVAHGEPGAACPHWARISSSGRLAGTFGLDDLAATAAGLSPRHPANLMGAFPVPRALNRPLASALVLGLAASVALGLGAARAQRRCAEVEQQSAGRLELLAAHLAHLEANRDRMGALRARMRATHEPAAPNLGDALRRLAAAIPDSVTLTSLTISPTAAFRLEADVSDDFKPQEAKTLLAGAGFDGQPGGGWVFDAPSRRLAVSGLLEEVRR